jgi:hypothetical protein
MKILAKSIVVVKLFIFGLLLSTPAEGQISISDGVNKTEDRTISKKKRALPSQGVSIGLHAPNAYPLGINYEFMLSHRVSMDLGFGLWGTGVGFNYYLTDPRRHNLNVFAGVSGNYMWVYESEQSLFLPIGIQYWGRRNFSYTLLLGPIWLDEPQKFDLLNGKPPIWMTAKIGYRMGYTTEQSKSPDVTALKHLFSGRVGLVNPFLGFTYEYLLAPWLSAACSFGILGSSIGANVYYPALRPGRVSLNVGVNAGLNLYPFEYTYYVPVGLTYLSKRKWFMGVDVGPQQFEVFDLPFGVSARLGWNFGNSGFRDYAKKYFKPAN